MACGDEYVDRAELGALKVIGSVGEPINAEAWHWYHDKVGRGNCPVVDTWWQTETGGIMISGLGNLSLQRPTYAGRPLPGIQPVLLDADGNEIEGDGVEGYLCIKTPVAVNASHYIRRSRTLQECILQQLQRLLLYW